MGKAVKRKREKPELVKAKYLYECGWSDAVELFITEIAELEKDLKTKAVRFSEIWDLIDQINTPLERIVE